METTCGIVDIIVEEDSDSLEMDAVARFFSQKLNLVNTLIRGNNESTDKVLKQSKFT